MKDLMEKQIIDYLSSNGFVKIEELSEFLKVSPSTVRRKLSDLQNRGLVVRSHGGAEIDDQKNYYPRFSLRSHQNTLAKKKMALSAVKLIKNGDVIFLDGSTSSYYVAEYLSEFKNLRVFTNGIDTLSLLAKLGINAYSTGGQVSMENPSVLVGHYADQTIKSVRADIAFFSVHSIDEQGETYDCFEQENVLRRSMIQNAKIKVLLCDGTKFDKTSAFHLCSINDVDYLVSDVDSSERFSCPLNVKLMSL